MRLFIFIAALLSSTLSTAANHTFIFKRGVPDLKVSASAESLPPLSEPPSLIFAESAWSPSLVSSPSLVIAPSKPTTTTFSENNRTVAFSSGLGSVGGAALPASGKWFWELERVSGAYLMAGMSTAPMGTHLQAYGCGMSIGAAAVGLYAGSSATKAPVSNAGSGARFGFAFDANTRTLHMYHGAAYQGSCTVPGTSTLYITALNGSSWEGSVARAHFRPEHQTLSAPSGYTAGVRISN